MLISNIPFRLGIARTEVWPAVIWRLELSPRPFGRATLGNWSGVYIFIVTYHTRRRRGSAAHPNIQLLAVNLFVRKKRRGEILLVHRRP